MKKDLVIGLLRTFVGLGLLGYTSYLRYIQANIIPTKGSNFDLTVLIIVGIISLMMIYVGLLKPCFKKPRLLQAIMGIFLILFPTYIGIIDIPEKNLFLGDILRFIGFLAVILSFTKICVYNKCVKQEEKQKETEMEVIEV